MELLIKSIGKDGEIEIWRGENNKLCISILNGHGECFYCMEEFEIKALFDYIKLTDERI